MAATMDQHWEGQPWLLGMHMNDTSSKADSGVRQIAFRFAGWVARTTQLGWNSARTAALSARARFQARERRPRANQLRNVNDDRVSGLWARTPVTTQNPPGGIDTLIFVGSRPIVDVRLEMFTVCVAVDVELDQEERLQRVIPIPQGVVAGELPELSIEPESIRLRWKLREAEKARSARRRASARTAQPQEPAAKPLRSDSTRAATPKRRDQSDG